MWSEEEALSRFEKALRRMIETHFDRFPDDRVFVRRNCGSEMDTFLSSLSKKTEDEGAS